MRDDAEVHLFVRKLRYQISPTKQVCKVEVPLCVTSVEKKLEVNENQYSRGSLLYRGDGGELDE